jgi:hypothetical protein
MSIDLQYLRLRQVVGELRKLDRFLGEHLHHVPFLRSAAKNFDARDLLAIATDLERESRSLEVYIAGVVGSGRIYAASIGHRQPQQIAGGAIAELRALSSKLPKQLAALKSELSSLRTESNATLNEPGRWGDAAIPNPVNDLFSFAQNVLDLIKRIKRL